MEKQRKNKEKKVIYEAEDELSPETWLSDTLVLDFPAVGRVRNNFRLLKRPGIERLEHWKTELKIEAEMESQEEEWI